ncbi:insulinase (Peptidase family M16) [Streptomyces sp. 1114.5]|uniref:insulinase family protein n=1 Tax=Streptomyces sp. 1114.5 TaxID=1938830 RepID=UPI000EABFC12|nr:insulinase family protein [Streptomyces sp. 1114.5]RKT16645.1 insulinase (Peptidase family M16) [Streptomyces sp. 1114.5]
MSGTEAAPAVPGPASDSVESFDAGGLRVEWEALPWARSIGAALVVGCGSRDDPAGREGTAHLAEHLQVLADPSADGPDGPDGSDDLGGIPLDAVTGIDRTTFRGTGDPDDPGRLVRRLLGIASGHRPRTTPDVFEGERNAVLLETRRMDHRPVLRLGPVLAAAAADEPGLDAIGRTTTRSVGRITPTDVHGVVERGYSGANARLFLAGPPDAADGVRAALDRHRPAGGPSRASGGAVAVPDGLREHGDLDGLHGLDGLVAVTLLRPRGTPSLALDALLDGRGPIVGHLAGDGLRPLGRTTVEGRAERVDMVVWRAADLAAPLERHLAQLLAGDWRTSVAALTSRLRSAREAARQWQLATPLGRVGDAADRCTFPGPPCGGQRIALWRVTDGTPECLARHPLS